jgi:type IV pilus assembly protein PilM
VGIKMLLKTRRLCKRLAKKCKQSLTRAQKIVTLYIDDTSLRLLVTHGTQIVKWADLPLEPGWVKNAVVIEEAEVANAIKRLFKAKRVKKHKVVVGVSGLHCLSRPITLPELPKAILAEAVRQEAKRVLPVPPEQLYLSWLTIPAPEEKTRVFLVAMPRNTVDMLLKVLNKAGLKPYFIDLKPLLLARIAKETTAIIADVQSTEFDIVIMADGVPQPVRTVSLPSEAIFREKKLPMIQEELGRTIEFYNSNNQENPLVSTVPIFVSGELANEPELCQSLSSELGHPVLPLPSPLEFPSGLDTNRYMVNIGLALQRLSSKKKAKPSVDNINILPVPYQAERPSLTKVFAIPSAAIAIGLLVLLAMGIQKASADTDLLQRQLNSMCIELSEKQALANDVDILEYKVADAEASLNSFTTALSNLEKQSNGVNGNLKMTMSSLPSNMNLKRIDYSSNMLIITGRSPSEKGILSYLDELNSSGKFAEITISNMTRIDDEWMDFTLLGNLDKQSTEVSGVEVVLKNLPTTISLVDVSYTDNALTVNGTSTDEDELLAYLQVLEASGKFSEVAITSMTKIDDEVMDFVLVLR